MFGPNVFFWCIVKVPLSDFFPKVSQAPSKCFSKWINWINWIISRIPRWIWKILFVLSSYEFLAMLEVPFFYGSIWWNNSVDFLRLAVSVFIRLYIHNEFKVFLKSQLNPVILILSLDWFWKVSKFYSLWLHKIVDSYLTKMTFCGKKIRTFENRS